MGRMTEREISKSASRQTDKPETRSDRRRSYGWIRVLLALAFGVMGLVNLGRAVQSYRNISLLADWESSLSPWVVLVLSVGWAGVFLAAGWGMLRRRRWGRWLGVRLPPIYGLNSVGMILLFARSPYARGQWVLVALGWMVGSLAAGWVLTRARIRMQFNK